MNSIVRVLIVIILCLLSFFSLCFSVSAATYTPYQGITDSSSQANILYDYYRNLDDFDYNDEFLIMRSGQYAYYLFYADSLDSNTVNYISYTGAQGSQNYSIDIGVDNNFNFVLNDYTTVGNIPGTGAYAEHYSSFHSFIIQVLSFVGLIVFIFYVFRSHKGEIS